MYNSDAQYMHIYLGPDLTELQVQPPGVQDGPAPSPTDTTATPNTSVHWGLSSPAAGTLELHDTIKCIMNSTSIILPFPENV